MNLTLNWDEGAVYHSYYVDDLGLRYNRYRKQGEPIRASEVIASEYALFDVEVQEESVPRLWLLARTTICALPFDQDRVVVSFHVPKTEIWLGYGDEALGARFLTAEAPEETIQLKALLDGLLESHRGE